MTSPYGFVGGYPRGNATARVADEADLQRAVTAYRFWYPTVSMEGIFTGNRSIGIADNTAVGIAACGPRQVGFTLNSDTPYGSAVLDLTDGPMVIDIPRGPFIGLVDDHHQRWITDMGIPGPDAGHGGTYVITPPGWTGGDLPPGAHVAASSTFKVLLAVRSMPVDGNLQAALDALRSIGVRPLSGQSMLGFVDTATTATDGNCLAWEDNLEFWKKLHAVLDAEPVLNEFRPMYGLLSALGIGKGHPFDPDARMTEVLSQAARTGREQMLTSAFASRRPDARAWHDRQWEWVGLVPDNADFETPAGIDLEARDRWFAQAIVTSPAMFRRQVGSGSLYWLAARDTTGTFLDGARHYTLTIPLPVPSTLFWSITIYDAQTRSQTQADQGRAALRSLFELHPTPNESTALTVHFAPTAPDVLVDRWLQTLPGRGWFAYLRIYGPQTSAFDDTWRPGDITPT